jgi:hypothetical protein
MKSVFDAVGEHLFFSFYSFIIHLFNFFSYSGSLICLRRVGVLELQFLYCSDAVSTHVVVSCALRVVAFDSVPQLSRDHLFDITLISVGN